MCMLTHRLGKSSCRAKTGMAFAGAPSPTWQKGDDPLLGVLLPSFHRKLVQHLHLEKEMQER